MPNRLQSRDIPLFWSTEELGPLRAQIENWYSKGIPITTIIRRSSGGRLALGRRPLIYADVYAALMDGIKRGKVFQRHNTTVDEMPISTFGVFFKTWKEGGSLTECIKSVAAPVVPVETGVPVVPKFDSPDVCTRIFRSLSERWRAENRGHRQALIGTPKKAVPAATANMLPEDWTEEKAREISQKVYLLVLRELRAVRTADPDNLDYVPDNGPKEEDQIAVVSTPPIVEAPAVRPLVTDIHACPAPDPGAAESEEDEFSAEDLDLAALAEDDFDAPPAQPADPAYREATSTDANPFD